MTTNPPSGTKTPPNIEYSHYRAAVKRNGNIWFLATPDGRNGLRPEDAKELIDALNGAADLRTLLATAQREAAQFRQHWQDAVAAKEPLEKALAEALTDRDMYKNSFEGAQRLVADAQTEIARLNAPHEL